MGELKLIKERLKWSAVEESLLLNYVLDGIQKGNTIKQSIKEFSSIYQVPESSVGAKWKQLAKKYKSFVETAKFIWENQVKPELEAKEQARKEMERRAEEDRKRRKEWRKQKKSKRVVVTTGKRVNPKDSGLYIKVDEHGVVQTVKKVILS